MRYEVCIFDLDGTLTDPIDGIINGIQYVIQKLNFNKKLENPGRFVGPPLNESFKNYFELTDAQTEEAVNTFREYYGVTGIYENEVYPGIARLLEYLYEEKIPLGVATTKPDNFARIVLKHFDLYKYFDIVVGDTPDSDLSRDGKQGLIRIVLDAVDPEGKKTAVMIGDRKHDILGARASGIDSIGVLWGYGSKTEFDESGATHTVQTPDELEQIIFG